MITGYFEINGVKVEVDYIYYPAEKEDCEYGMPLNNAEPEQVEINGVWVDGTSRSHSLGGLFDDGVLKDQLEKIIIDSRRLL